jgi:H2-forming N5,N10-methylenetetrahydromethanopterin dehydrogenase-like enzyme
MSQGKELIPSKKREEKDTQLPLVPLSERKGVRSLSITLTPSALVRTNSDEKTIDRVRELQLIQQRLLTGRGDLERSKDAEVRDLIKNMKETDEEMKTMIGVIEMSFVIVLIVGIIMMLKRIRT